MRHATKETLERLEDLLQEIRKISALTEKGPGVFYRRRSAFLHFHDDPLGIFADIKLGGGWERVRVNTARERLALLRAARQNAQS
jgi:hypothetical protein